MVWHRYDSTRPPAVRQTAALLRVLDARRNGRAGRDLWGSEEGQGGEEAEGPPSPWYRPPPASWGRLVTGRTGVPVQLTAVSDGRPVVLQGTVNPESAVKSGRYRIMVPGHASATADEPWPGVRGAAVLCHGLVIGVVADAVRDRGTARLSAVPAETLFHNTDARELVGPGCLEAAELRPALETDGAASRAPEPPETDALTQWCGGSEAFSVRLVVGASGEHRGDLARALMRRMAGHDWAVGAVALGADERALSALADVRVPLLLVVDRADARQTTLTHLMEAVSHRAFAGPATPVRLLLLADDDGDWWWETRSEALPLRDLPGETVLRLSGVPSAGRPTTRPA